MLAPRPFRSYLGRLVTVAALGVACGSVAVVAANGSGNPGTADAKRVATELTGTRTQVTTNASDSTSATTFSKVEAARSAAVTPTVPSVTAPVQGRLGAFNHFTHFTVAAGNVIKSEAQGHLVFALTCVRTLPPGSSGGKTRVSWNPWTITTTKGTFTPSVFDGSHPPQMMFPTASRLPKGECVSGYIPFAKATGTVTRISYANGVGDRVTWSMPPKASLALGQSKTLGSFKVSTSAVKIDANRYWYGAKVKVCVASLPKGKSSARVSWDPWTMTTNKGVLTQLTTQEGDQSFGPGFPSSATLRLGQCAAGWIGFPLTSIGDGIAATQVNYHNSLGNRVSWTTTQ